MSTTDTTDAKDAHNQKCCEQPLRCSEDHIGAGSHYWTLHCDKCGKRYTFDTYKFELREWPYQITEMIVAEVSKSWPAVITEPIDIISKRFEEVIRVNRERGYKLNSWQLSAASPSRGIMVETIIAVFVKV